MVASNRGPGQLRARRSGASSRPGAAPGGLVTALSGVFYRDDTTWVSAAMTEGDRAVALKGRTVAPDSHQRDAVRRDPARALRRLLQPDLEPDPVVRAPQPLGHRRARRCSTTPRRRPGRLRRDQPAFAQALADEADRRPRLPDPGLPPVASCRACCASCVPDAKIVHFSHTPFAGATYLRILPVEHARRRCCAGLAGADVLGFQSKQWAENYLLSARSLPGLHVLRGGRMRARRTRRRGPRVPGRGERGAVARDGGQPTRPSAVREELRELARATVR